MVQIRSLVEPLGIAFCRWPLAGSHPAIQNPEFLSLAAAYHMDEAAATKKRIFFSLKC